MRGGEAVKEIVESFCEIGYNVNKPIRLNAEDFGVPQRRRRVVIIGSLKKFDIIQPKPMFSDADSSLPKIITVREAIGSLPPIKAGGGKDVTDEEVPSNTPYDRLMKSEISFEEFYEQSKKW